MPDLSAFLLARIAEDERTISSGVFSGIMQYYGMDEADGDDQEDANDATKAVMEYLRPRVLAECEAKRRMVALWAEEWPEWHGRGSGLVRTAMTNDQYSRVLDAERVLGLLANVYKDHPDFDPSWRVD